MKTIGVIGGLSWQSTTYYYQQMNIAVNTKLGGLHSAKINLVSLDFAEIAKLMNKGDWPLITQKLIIAAQKIEASKADFIMIANNTLHKVAADLEKSVNMPLLHIADVIGAQLVKDDIRCVGLLGTLATMELGFYKDRLREKFAINVITPKADDRKVVQKIIFDELCLGEFKESSKKLLLALIGQLQNNGAEAIILGCTELPLLIHQDDIAMPLYDSSQLHCQAAVKLAVNNINPLDITSLKDN